MQAGAAQSGLPDTLRRRIVRYTELRPQLNSFMDSRTPGNEAKETFSVIGGGVIENPNRFVHIKIPHGFDMGGARMPPGCTNSQHSHDEAEAFLVHRGTFTFTLGPNAEDGELELTVGDFIALPTHIFRGFRNSGSDIGHLVSILGGGRVTWAPSVFEEARGHGLVLLANGKLVDTAKGEQIPAGLARQTPTTESDLAHFRRMTPADLRSWYVRLDEIRPALASPLARPGVDECPVLGCTNPAEGLPAAAIPASHGFQVRRVRMRPGAVIPAHARQEVEVLFVQDGSVEIAIGGNTVALGKGDYFSLPVGMPRVWRNSGQAANDIQVVRGGDHPAAPAWSA